MKRAPALSVYLSLLMLSATGAVAADAPAPRLVTLDIAAQPLGDALNEFGKQTNITLVFYDTAIAHATNSQPLSGKFTTEDALVRLLSNTGLTYQYLDERTIAIRASKGKTEISRNMDEGAALPVRQELRLAQAEVPKNETPAAAAAEDKGIPEIFVNASSLLNMDIPRSKDDAQPYVIFDRTTIDNSGAINLEDFLKQRLTMNNVGQTPSQFPGPGGNSSRLNLRGLGFNQTLILIDGHRTAGPVTLEGPQQTDLNGIPLAAVERIEVLPTTASGIYGGSATGGVINIIMRRDYSGSDVKLTYDDTFDGSAPTRRVDASTGFSLEDGKTTVLLAGSYSEAEALSSGDRLQSHQDRGRRIIFANNPAFYAGVANPPLGYTTNIRSVDGSPLFGAGTSHITFVPVGYAGGGGAGPLQANAGRFNFDLAQTATRTGGARVGLTNAPKVESLITTVRRQFTEKVQGFLEIGASNNRSEFSNGAPSSFFTIAQNAPNNPFGKAIRVSVPLAAADTTMQVSNYDRRAIGGVIVQLPRKWRAEADYTWNRTRADLSGQATNYTAAAIPLVRDGVIDVLRDTNLYPIDFSQYIGPRSRYVSPIYSTFKNATVRVAGPLGSLPGGAPVISTLVEHRDELFGEGRYFAGGNGLTAFLPEQSQSVDALYLEAQIPLISAKNAMAGIEELDFQVAARHERYEVNGSNSFLIGNTPVERRTNKTSSTNPTIGVRYRPVKDLMLRGSFGTGFLPPSVQQLVPSPSEIDPSTYFDPRRGGEAVFDIESISGGNPNLQPEESETWSMGVVLTPRFMPGFRLSVDYMLIEKDGNISFVGAEDVIDNEAFFPGRVIRANPAPNDPYGVGAIIGVDTTLVNISKARAETYDVQMDYQLSLRSFGELTLAAAATWQTHYQTQILPTSPLVENVGIDASFNPLKFKSNATVSWDYRQWTLGWAARYFDSYRQFPLSTAFINQGNNGVVPSQVYHDFYATYRLARQSESSGLASRLFGGMEVRLGVKNVFDKEPPFDAAAQPAFYSYLGDPRLSSYSLSVRQSF